MLVMHRHQNTEIKKSYQECMSYLISVKIVSFHQIVMFYIPYVLLYYNTRRIALQGRIQGGGGSWGSGPPPKI